MLYLTKEKAKKRDGELNLKQVYLPIHKQFEFSFTNNIET
jgi:hypothetical protein